MPDVTVTHTQTGAVLGTMKSEDLIPFLAEITARDGKVADVKTNVELVANEGVAVRGVALLRSVVDLFKARGADFATLDAKESTFHAFDVQDSVFDDCDFRDSLFKRGAFSNTSLKRGNFAAARFSSAEVNRCDFTGSDLAGAMFDHVMLDESTFDNTKLAGVTFRNCVISNTAFLNCDLSGASFENPLFQNVSFDGVDLRGVGCKYARFLDCPPFSPSWMNFKSHSFVGKVLHDAIADGDREKMAWAQFVLMHPQVCDDYTVAGTVFPPHIETWVYSTLGAAYKDGDDIDPRLIPMLTR